MSAKDEFAGRKLKCAACGEVVRIPSPPAADGTIVPERPSVAVARKKPPLAGPVVVAEAPPLATLVTEATTSAALKRHPWVDDSLQQTPTPWLPGDEARFQAGIKPMREGLRCWEKLALLLVASATIVGAIVVPQFIP
jgi:hypothetical protein